MNRPRITCRTIAAVGAVIVILLGLGGVGLAVWEGFVPLPAHDPPANVTPAATPTDGGVYLVGAGDIGECGLPGAGLTADLLAHFPGATFFAAGDNAYQTGTLRQYQNCFNPSWGRYKDRIHPVPGNHDWATPGAQGYFDYFGAAAGEAGQGWYSFDLNGWHIVVLDSECGHVRGCQAGSPQEKWLKADLAAHPALCSLAIWHHPLFSSGLHGNNMFTQPFWNDLYAAGAEIVINGHDHDYERFDLQDPSGNPDAAHGIREFVVGTGGAFEISLPGKPAANSQRFITGEYGVIALTLYPDHYAWEFIPAGGSQGDNGSGECH
jgi:acid phosphatase type 7